MESCSTPSTNLCPGHVTGVPAFLFSNLVNTLMAAQCALGGTEAYPEDVGHRLQPEYDFVVVGAGSAGAIIANRLTEVSNWTVLLVEAGGDPSLTSEIPGLTFSTLGSEMDWSYRVEPQAGSCEGMVDKRCNWPRGKVLGGSSTINAMLYVGGNQGDYDEWAAAGNDGWSYEEVLRYFKKSEDYLHLDHFDDADPLKHDLLQAWQELGYDRLENSLHAEVGVVKAFGTVHKGARYHTGKAFLAPIKDRKNLHVAKNSHVMQVVVDPEERRATGVQIRRGDKVIDVEVRKEVILSAGAVGSPQILMLSGIGPRKHLEDIGISVLEDLKVGHNLQDHVIFPGVAFSINKSKSPTAPNKVMDATYAYLAHRAGPLASLGVTDIVSFGSTTNGTRPDLQFHHFRLPYNDTNMMAEYTRMSGFRPEVAKAFFGLGAQADIVLAAPTLLHPRSRGIISLESKDPFEHPRIQTGYLSEEEDVATMLKGIQLALKLQDTKAMQGMEGTPMEVKLRECSRNQFLSVEYWKCLLRHLSNTIYHPVGTCKMGPEEDADAVVDPQLKVKRIRGLRVADSSIMPTVTSGNINAPVMMIAEKAADIIKKEWNVL